MGCSIVEWYEMLKNADWYFEFSDDQRVWESGKEEMEELEETALELGGDYRRMFDEFKEAMFSGDAFGTPKKELPRINEYL